MSSSLVICNAYTLLPIKVEIVNLNANQMKKLLITGAAGQVGSMQGESTLCLLFNRRIIVHDICHPNPLS